MRAQTTAITPTAKAPAEPIKMSRMPAANVSKGLSQKAALRAVEWVYPVNHCHMKATIPADAAEVSSGGNHFRGWKWCL